MTRRMVAAMAQPAQSTCSGIAPAGCSTGRGPAGVGVRRRRGARARAASSTPRSRSTAGPSGSTRPSASCAKAVEMGLQGRRSAPTRTRPSSSNGSPSAPTAPRSAACRWRRSSTRGRSTTCWPGPRATVAVSTSRHDDRPTSTRSTTSNDRCGSSAATGYADSFEALTGLTIEPLLDAVGAHSGSDLLDIGTGPVSLPRPPRARCERHRHRCRRRDDRDRAGARSDGPVPARQRGGAAAARRFVRRCRRQLRAPAPRSS